MPSEWDLTIHALFKNIDCNRAGQRRRVRSELTAAWVRRRLPTGRGCRRASTVKSWASWNSPISSAAPPSASPGAPPPAACVATASPPVHSPPCLLYAARAGAHSAELYSPADRTTYTVPLPDPLIGDRYIIGSSHGWLVSRHRLNPATVRHHHRAGASSI
jgi:hypothetical protein